MTVTLADAETLLAEIEAMLPGLDDHEAAELLENVEQIVDALAEEIEADLARWWVCDNNECDGEAHDGWEWLHARAKQHPPTGEWLVWLILAGRGWGKTRTGAEWLAEQVMTRPRTRWAIIAPTFGDARDTCVEGESGLLAVFDRRGWKEKTHYIWNRSIGEVITTNGCRIRLFASETPERLRGPQFHGAWCDELAAWVHIRDVWDMLQMCLRLGANPQAVVTTTPKPLTILRQIRSESGCETTTGTTFENLPNLSPMFQRIIDRYTGTNLGRQELYAEILDDIEGALWRRVMIEVDRVFDEPVDEDGVLALTRIVVAVDPNVTESDEAPPHALDDVGVRRGGHDECGIMIGGIGPPPPGWTPPPGMSPDTPHAYILEDATTAAGPSKWARRVVGKAREYAADRVIGEVNNGGDLVEMTLRTVPGGNGIPYRKVNATRGKRRRSEPVVALYEQHRVHHVGMLPELEDEQCQWTDDVDWSPNRMDALVWLLTELAVDGQRTYEGAIAR